MRQSKQLSGMQSIIPSLHASSQKLLRNIDSVFACFHKDGETGNTTGDRAVQLSISLAVKSKCVVD